MQNYKKYHTDIKVCYALGIQKEVLPEKFTKEIPNSTSHYWKNKNPEKYVGAEFASGIQESLDDTKVFLDKRLYFSRKAFIRLGRLYITLITLIGTDNIKKLIKSNRNVFVDLLESLSEDFPIEKRSLLRFLQISTRQYQSWLSDRKFACHKSLIGQCFKRRPLQISPSEIETLKKYMNNANYKIWCIRSVWGKAVRNGAVSMAESTWYKYAKELGFSAKRKLPKKPRKKGSFNASCPNETWHADISQYKTFDNVIFYIYTVVDNFSRKIISWDISAEKSAKIRTQTIKRAVENEFDVYLENQKVDLIVDGGSENNNKTIHQFIQGCQVKIDKKIALKDVTFSNSIVEGPYKIMKSYYFRSKQILSTTIYQELAFFIANYNNEKPCDKHKIYTPNEVHQNPELASVKLVLDKSNKKRLEENRNFCCKLAG